MTRNDFYSLKLGEEKWDGPKGILKVPTGWVIMFYDQKTDKITSSTFIPLTLNI